MMYFTADHEWLRIEGDTAVVGITAHAAGLLGEIVFVEVKPVGTLLVKGAVAALVESVKAASEIYAPIAAEIVDWNDAIISEPALLVRAPETDGWIVRIKLADADAVKELLDRDAYLALLR